MVGSRALGLVLLILLPPALGIDNLQNIIKFLHGTYGDGNNQVALAINVPARYCDKDAVLDNNFLSQDRDQQKVKKDMNDLDYIYKGQQLIGARPKPIPKTTANYHSEYLLLIKSMSQTLAPYDPLMKTLLNSDPNGCNVFYTYNSPCVNTCSTPNKPYSIIPALNMFKNRRGPQAFVFQKVWKYDSGKDKWEDNLKEIDKIIPVFRCDATCVRCVNNKVVDNRCK